MANYTINAAQEMRINKLLEDHCWELNAYLEEIHAVEKIADVLINVPAVRYGWDTCKLDTFVDKDGIVRKFLIVGNSGCVDGVVNMAGSSIECVIKGIYDTWDHGTGIESVIAYKKQKNGSVNVKDIDVTSWPYSEHQTVCFLDKDLAKDPIADTKYVIRKVQLLAAHEKDPVKKADLLKGIEILEEML